MRRVSHIVVDYILLYISHQLLSSQSIRVQPVFGSAQRPSQRGLFPRLCDFIKARLVIRILFSYCIMLFKLNSLCDDVTLSRVPLCAGGSTRRVQKSRIGALLGFMLMRDAFSL